MTIEKLITDHIDIWSSALQTRSTAGRGSNGKIDLYGIKKLRELILELAVRGKLVPQDPNDEPASELLKRIAAEKAELVKQGKIKKQKPLPEISEDEKPFELPEGWAWTSLSDISEINPKIDVAADEQEISFVPMPCISTRFDGKHEQEIRMWREVKKGYTHFSNGDIGLAKITPCFENSKAVIFSDLKNGVGVGTTELHVARPCSSEINLQYILLNIKSPNFLSVGESRMTGSAGQKRVPKVFFETFPLPFPPLVEQARIVEVFSRLMTICDQLEQQSLTCLNAHQQLVETLLATLTDSPNAKELSENWARVSQHFDTLFTTEASLDTLKQTILQLAVMGKLVPQDPNDEPASELLKRIEQEKAQLVKDGKIKKQKPLPPISDEEKPFELPEGWEWCRLSELFKYITDGDHQAPPKASDGIPFLVIGNLNKGEISFLETKFVPKNYYESLDWTKKPTSRDMLYTVTGSYGIPIIVNNDTAFCVQRHVAILKSCQSTPVIYLKNFFLTYYAINFATKIATGIAQKTVPLTGLREMYVPLPPENEIARIINKIQVLDKIFLSLKSRLQTVQQTQLHLAEALTDAALR